MAIQQVETKPAFDKIHMGKHNTNRFLKIGAKLSHQAKADRELAAFRERVKDGKASPKVRFKKIDRTLARVERLLGRDN